MSTEAGQILAAHLKRALGELRAGLEEIWGAEGRASGTVRVGLVPAGGAVLVPRALRLLRRRHPEAVVTVRTGVEPDLLALLRAGDLDLVVGTLNGEAETRGETVITRLTKDHVEVVARAGHPLARGQNLSLAEILSLEWILPPRGSALRTWFSRVLESEGLPEPKPIIETASLSVLRGALLEGDCVALSTRLECWHEIVEQNLFDALTIPALAWPSVERPFYLHVARRQDARPSPAATAFFALLADAAVKGGYDAAPGQNW